jgi:hypothetical protein
MITNSKVIYINKAPLHDQFPLFASVLVMDIDKRNIMEHSIFNICLEMNTENLLKMYTAENCLMAFS